MSTGCDAHLNALASATLGHLLLVLLGDLGSLTADLLGANGGGVQGQSEVPGERVGSSVVRVGDRRWEWSAMDDSRGRRVPCRHERANREPFP